MRYGLPKEENPKKKWKASVENELMCLKKEVDFLRNQLDDTKNRLIELQYSKQSGPLSFSAVVMDQNPFSKCDIKNFPSTSAHPFTSTLKVTNTERIQTGFSNSRQENPFAPMGAGQYQSTWDYDVLTKQAIRLHNITCMPRYHKNEKSCEELRFDDYYSRGISFSNQIQRFFKQRSEKNNFSFVPLKNWKPLPKKPSEGTTNEKPFCIPWYLTPKQPKAPWPFGPSLGSNNPASSKVVFPELTPIPVYKENLEVEHQLSFCESSPSPITKANVEVKHRNSKPIFVRKTGLKKYWVVEKKNYSNVDVSNKDETLSSQVLPELKKLGEQMSTLQDQMVTMNSNLSNVSSRVSVMDSRLSAVDMFVTMQRFDKKWQGLETKLADFGTPSPDKSYTMLHNEIISKVVNHSQKNEIVQGESALHKVVSDVAVSPSGDEKNCNPETPKSGESNNRIISTATESEMESLPALDTSDMNISDFVRSISCTDTPIGSKMSTTLSHSSESIVSMEFSPFNVKRDSAPIEMDYLKSAPIDMDYLKSSHSLTKGSLVDNSDHQENYLVNSRSRSVCSLSATIDNDKNKDSTNNEDKKTASTIVLSTDSIGGNKEVHEDELQMNTAEEVKNSDFISNDPLGVIADHNESSSELGLTKETDTDPDNDEFVIVQKSDVGEYMENSKAQTSEVSSDEFKMYTDITEYLEINLGKKKNLVYEFGFEAKPDYLIGTEESSGQERKDGIEENKAGTSSADESFQQFKSNFLGKKSVDAKQSSPFVFFNSKSPEKPSENNSFGRKC